MVILREGTNSNTQNWISKVERMHGQYNEDRKLAREDYGKELLGRCKEVRSTFVSHPERDNWSQLEPGDNMGGKVYILNTQQSNTAREYVQEIYPLEFWSGKGFPI